LLKAVVDEVADRLAGLPIQNVGTETIVGETFGRVDEGVAGDLETDIDGFYIRLVRSCGFVGMELDSPAKVSLHSMCDRQVNLQSPELRLQRSLVYTVRYTQQLIEVALLS
jgi:hypothetical protein